MLVSMLLVASGRADSYAQFITVLVLFVLVLAVTALTTRWLAGYQKQQNLNGNIEVLETQRIGAGKYLQIIRVGEKYLVIALCKDTVTMLTEVTKEQIIQGEAGKTDFAGFGELFEKVKKINSGKNQEPKEK